MAAMLDALAPYVKKLIADMTEEELDMLLGVSSEIKKLENKTEGIKCFVADAERRRITDESVQRWVTKLKGAMYDATDILDLCWLEADKRRESKYCNSMEENASDCFRSLLFCLRNPVFSHKIGNRIKELNQQLDEIHKEAIYFKFSIIDKPAATDHAEVSSRRMTSEFNQSDIVGRKIEIDTKELVQKLVSNDKDDPNIEVVSIVGMGGIGKTTLAQKIFKEMVVQDHFKIKIWLSITKHFDETELLRTAIKHANVGYNGNLEQYDNTLLTRTLTNVLSKGRFLLVMDDVWDVKAWSDVLRVPVMDASRKQPGSRVLITTRLDDLALQFQAFFYPHRVSLLDEEDAWSLLKKQLSPNQVAKVDELKGIGMKILEKCNGLPLAVKVMGGLLSTKNPSEYEWQVVLNNPAWSVSGLPPELDSRIYLSYEDLSPQLKQCFLYCSLFPKGEKIPQVAVTSMWISEGFIHHSGVAAGADGLEEIATKYYKELIRRNLIEPAVKSTISQYFCTMHDVVRSFAEFMAREESLVVIQDMMQAAAAGTSSPIRRLSIGRQTQPGAHLEWAIFLQKQKSLRTLMILGSSSTTNNKLSDFVATFSCLRVLHIDNVESSSLVRFLSQLKHLRFLSLRNTDISRLPDDIDKMKFLRSIVLLNCKNFSQLPKKIIKLPHLTELVLTGSNVTLVPKGFGGLTNLRSLYGFPVHMETEGNESWCSLQEIGPLSHLRDLVLFDLENASASSWAEKAMISSKEHLSLLGLYCSDSQYMGFRNEMEKEQKQRVVEEVFQKLCPPSCIENLKLWGYFGRRLPDWMTLPTTTSFTRLRMLTLQDLPCCTQLPDGLCRLRSLELLVILDALAIKSVGPEFQASSSSATSAIGFPKLIHLCLEGLCEWEEWEWEEDVTDAAETIAMPALEGLVVHNSKLHCLPPGLASSKRHALQKLYLKRLTNLTYLDNFRSVEELDVFYCPQLKRISGLSKLRKIRILYCPNLEVLEPVPLLESLVLEDATMETLPAYLRGVEPMYLDLVCSEKLYESLSPGRGSEWDKICHIRNRNIYFVDSDED